MDREFDFVVVGAGSAGCAAAAGLAEAGIGTVCVLEAGPSDASPLVKVPFGLLWLMGGRRDWCYRTAPQASAGGRRVKAPRGRMLGGSSSINSMVWFRGRADDYDGWDLPGWGWEAEVAPAFEAVEARMGPARLPHPHPASEAFGRAMGANDDGPPTPERESAGVFAVNMRDGRRWSAADGFLRPARAGGRLDVMTGAEVDRLSFAGGRPRAVHLIDGRTVTARRGVVLSAGSFGSPAILMRSGIGPAAHLRAHGIEVLVDAPGVGANLHDHPSSGLHMVGPRTGYGLTWDQAAAWAAAPARWLMRRDGRMTSNFVEAGAFFRAGAVGADGDARPDAQVHFFPYMMGWQGRAITRGAGYFADVNLCRPRSRGTLRLASADPRAAPEIDLGLLSDPADLTLLVAALRRLRRLLDAAPFEAPAEEAHPGRAVETEAGLAEHVRSGCGTSYHPVGTLAMGRDAAAPVAPDLRVRGVDGLWAADASVMPAIPSSNTNAPSIMIGHRAAAIIAASP